MRGPYAAQCLILLFALSACSKEARSLGPAVPQTPPHGPSDPRIAQYQDNVFQISQGGRYFSWYGCGACHSDALPGVRNLADRHWTRGSGFDRVYAAIVQRHPAQRYAVKVPTEQLWQITAYVRDLPTHYPEKRHRQDVDQVGEPQGASWTGPVR